MKQTSPKRTEAALELGAFRIYWVIIPANRERLLMLLLVRRQWRRFTRRRCIFRRGRQEKSGLVVNKFAEFVVYCLCDRRPWRISRTLGV